MTSLLFSRFRIGLKSFLKVLLCPAGLIFRPQTNGPLVLMYHRVNSIPFKKLGPVSRELTVPIAAFEDQMLYLKSHGYKSVSLAALALMLEGKAPLDRKSVLITFDDGYEDNLLDAAPLLRKQEFGATVFAMSDHLGKGTADLWPLGDPDGNGKLMSGKQIAEWTRAGFELGSHTRSHPVLVQLDDAALWEELNGSREALEAISGLPVSALAYPGGEFDLRVEKMALKAGYRLCFTTKSGRSGVGSSLTSIRRVEVSASDNSLVFRIKMAGLLDWTGFRDSGPYRSFLRALHRFVIAASKLFKRRGAH